MVPIHYQTELGPHVLDIEFFKNKLYSTIIGLIFSPSYAGLWDFLSTDLKLKSLYEVVCQLYKEF